MLIILNTNDDLYQLGYICYKNIIKSEMHFNLCELGLSNHSPQLIFKLNFSGWLNLSLFHFLNNFVMETYPT